MFNLNSPIEIKGIKAKNRLVLPPMATDTCVEGKPTDKTYDNYRSYAAGSVGTVIIEHNYIHISGKFSKGQMSIESDAFQEEHKKLSRVVHDYDVIAGVQVSHAGSGTKTEITALPLCGPSAIKHPTSEQVPNEVSLEDIKKIKAKFVEASLRVKSANFDFVELHAAHGYLLNEFYSPLTNIRGDEYGGNLEKRLRMLLEVISDVRKAVGADFPIFMRFGAVDMLEGGSTEQDAAFAAPRLVEAGVDVIDVSGGMCGSRPVGMKQGHFVPAAIAVKKAVKVPIIVTGGITEYAYANDLVKEGKADMVGVARAFMKDKDWVKKALAATK